MTGRWSSRGTTITSKISADNIDIQVWLPFGVGPLVLCEHIHAVDAESKFRRLLQLLYCQSILAFRWSRVMDLNVFVPVAAMSKLARGTSCLKFMGKISCIECISGSQAGEKAP